LRVAEPARLCERTARNDSVKSSLVKRPSL
jgi:hypothetical protein